MISLASIIPLFLEGTEFAALNMNESYFYIDILPQEISQVPLQSGPLPIQSPPLWSLQSFIFCSGSLKACKFLSSHPVPWRLTSDGQFLWGHSAGTCVLLSLLPSLVVCVNHEKSTLTPKRYIHFIGLSLDLTARAYLPWWGFGLWALSYVRSLSDPGCQSELVFPSATWPHSYTGCDSPGFIFAANKPDFSPCTHQRRAT